MTTINYGGAHIFVRPVDLGGLATSIETTTTSLVGHVRTILLAIHHLTDTWTGDASAEVQNWVRQLTPACDAVFGADGPGAEPGALPAYIASLRAAAAAFDQTDRDLASSWHDFSHDLLVPDDTPPTMTGIGTAPGGQPTYTNSPSTDPHTAALTFDAPTP